MESNTKTPPKKIVEQGTKTTPVPLPRAKGKGTTRKVAKAPALEGEVINKGGRPSDFSQELVDSICEMLAEGKSLRSICREENMPAMSTIFKWLRTHDEFSEQYARAKQEGADALADDIQDMAEEVYQGRKDPIAARVAIDAKKWVASKLKPKVYGDKLDVTTGNEKINRGVSDAELDAILGRVDDKASTSSKA